MISKVLSFLKANKAQMFSPVDGLRKYGIIWLCLMPFCFLFFVLSCTASFKEPYASIFFFTSALALLIIFLSTISAFFKLRLGGIGLMFISAATGLLFIYTVVSTEIEVAYSFLFEARAKNAASTGALDIFLDFLAISLYLTIAYFFLRMAWYLKVIVFPSLWARSRMKQNASATDQNSLTSDNS